MFVNSKLKSNGLNAVEGKFRNRTPQKSQDPRVTSTRGAPKFFFGAYVYATRRASFCCFNVLRWSRGFDIQMVREFAMRRILGFILLVLTVQAGVLLVYARGQEGESPYLR